MRHVLLLAVLGGAASLPLTGPESAMLERVADDVAELERVVEGVGFERMNEVEEGEGDGD